MTTKDIIAIFLGNLKPRAYIKTFVTLSRFWPSRGCGCWGLSEAVKKGKFLTKIFFSDNVEWSSLEKYYLVENDIFQLWKFNLNGWSRYIELNSHVQVYWIFWEILFFVKKSEIWAKYGQWCYCFKFLEEIRLHWLFHVGFGEIRFLIWLRFLVFQSIKSFQVCHYSS